VPRNETPVELLQQFSGKKQSGLKNRGYQGLIPSKSGAIRPDKVLRLVASWSWPHRSMTLWGGKMIPKALFRFDSAHTRDMREE
jgi:hypothetical protein